LSQALKNKSRTSGKVFEFFWEQANSIPFLMDKNKNALTKNKNHLKIKKVNPLCLPKKIQNEPQKYNKGLIIVFGVLLYLFRGKKCVKMLYFLGYFCF
jgi:hypothetical protein